MANKGETCLLVDFCGNKDKPQVLNCQYKSSQELCFGGIVFDVGPETMDKLNTRERLKAVRAELEDAKISGQYFSNGDKM